MSPAIRVTKEFTFDSAHFIPGHSGKCAGMHGHTYRLQVTLGMPTCRFDDKVGMVVDFSVLSDVVRTKIIDRVDHKVLNEVLDYAPTAENMALNFGLEMLPLVGALVGPVYLDSIRLWETPNSFAEYITEASPCRNCDCQ